MIPAIFLWLGINAVQAQTRLSIEDCRRMALENSDDIKISSRKVGKAVSDRQAAKQPISRKYQDRQPMPIFSKTSIWVWWVWK